MNLLRRAAVKISNGVVRRSSPDTREWAQATAREVEFIEGDWAALGWALGSVRILWQRGETPIMSAADVPRAARQFAREIRRRTILGCSTSSLVAIIFSLSIWGQHRLENTVIGHMGEYLMLAGILNGIVRFIVTRGRLPSRRDFPVTVVEYRGELARQRDFIRGLWHWSSFVFLLLGWFLFSAGAVIANPELSGQVLFQALVLLIGSGFVIRAGPRQARKYQQRIDELDAVERTA